MTEATVPFIEDVPFDAGEVAPQPDNARGAPRASGRIGKLGGNKRARGGPRKLTNDDIDKLAGMYGFAALAIQPLNPKVAAAFAESADSCADAWRSLAEQNDAVRRAILWIIEGGALGAVFLAHMPILIAAIPEDKLPPMFNLFAASDSITDERIDRNGYPSAAS